MFRNFKCPNSFKNPTILYLFLVATLLHTKLCRSFLSIKDASTKSSLATTSTNDYLGGIEHCSQGALFLYSPVNALAEEELVVVESKKKSCRTCKASRSLPTVAIHLSQHTWATTQMPTCIHYTRLHTIAIYS